MLRLAVAHSCPLDEVSVVYGDPMAFHRNHKSLPMELRHIDAGFRYYEAVLQAKLTRFMYVFHLTQGEEQLFYSESGLSQGYEFDLAFISAFQFVGENRMDFIVDKPSWQGRTFYQIFPERFASRDDPKTKPYVNAPWDCKTLASKRNPMLGGDLYGVIDKLDYLKDLGVGAIYLTPIHPSPSNHKYDVLDYFDVEPRFGGKKAFRELVEKAHRRGMKVMMDLVFNHTAVGHPFFEDVKRLGRKSKYHSWYFISGDKPTARSLNYRCFGYHPHMPKLDTNNPEVQDYLISVGEYWMKEFGVDGYRLDVSEGVSHDFWVKFKIAIKKIDPEVLVLGENWLNAESYLGANQFDGVMNYPFLGTCSAFALGIKDARATALALDGLLMRYKDGHDRMMLNILSSHDVQRLKTLCRGDAEVALLCFAIMFFYLGYPMVYYGEEIFMDGAGDPDNRQGMAWGDKEFGGVRFELMKKLMHLRQEDPLAKGSIALYEENGMLCIKRVYQGKTHTLYANMSAQGAPYKGRFLFGNRSAGGQVWPKGFAVVEG